MDTHGDRREEIDRWIFYMKWERKSEEREGENMRGVHSGMQPPI